MIRINSLNVLENMTKIDIEQGVNKIEKKINYLENKVDKRKKEKINKIIIISSIILFILSYSFSGSSNIIDYENEISVGRTR